MKPSGDDWMKLSKRCVLFSISMLFVVCFATSSFGQAKDPEAAAAVTSGEAGYSRVTPFAVDLSQTPQLFVSPSIVFDAVTGAVLGAGGGQGNANTNGKAGAAASNEDGNFSDVRHTPT